MFGSLISELREALDEEAKKLMPFRMSADKIRQNNEMLKQIRREAGYGDKPLVNTKRKVLFRLGGSSE